MALKPLLIEALMVGNTHSTTYMEKDEEQMSNYIKA